ncbi:8765_t:CDS:2 [Funneliformis caledonium]|uniref:8765_t:CDS:1 n=1 Tax=Funneliformis caledonium TaxID=1117310 RepID=A0A9N9EUI9_9GLOM|nr:8765_t:CDS:2 [Funneliformis caledonium]
MTGLQPRRGPWLPQEENDLISYFNDIGADWFEISSRLMTRNAQQCRRRYILDVAKSLIKDADLSRYNYKGTMEYLRGQDPSSSCKPI